MPKKFQSIRLIRKTIFYYLMMIVSLRGIVHYLYLKTYWLAGFLILQDVLLTVFVAYLSIRAFRASHVDAESGAGDNDLRRIQRYCALAVMLDSIVLLIRY